MVVFVLTEQVPPILAVALLILVYLTGSSSGTRMTCAFLWKAFWVLFVFLGHVFGYAVFRAWLALHRRGRASA